MRNPFDTKNKYNFIAAVTGSALLASILIILFLMRPAWGSLKAIGREIPQEQLKRDQAELDVKNLEAAKKYLTGNTSAVKSINTAVPIQPEVPQILVMLEGLAARNGVTLTSFVPQQRPVQSAVPAPSAPQSSGLEPVEITAQYQGDYASLLSFFYNLERSQRIVDVKSFSTTAKNNGQRLEGTITFTGYYHTVDGGPSNTPAQPATGGAR